MRWEVIVAGQKTKRLKKSNDTIITRTSPPLGGLGGKNRPGTSSPFRAALNEVKGGWGAK